MTLSTLIAGPGKQYPGKSYSVDVARGTKISMTRTCTSAVKRKSLKENAVSEDNGIRYNREMWFFTKEEKPM